jgi:hypothetical protein
MAAGVERERVRLRGPGGGLVRFGEGCWGESKRRKDFAFARAVSLSSRIWWHGA